MEEFVNLIIDTLSKEKLDQFQQELTEIFQAYQVAESQRLEAKAKTNAIGRLNPFSDDENVKEYRKANSKASELKEEYKMRVDALATEIDQALQKIFPFQLALLIEQLSSSIDKVRADVIAYDSECYSSVSANLYGTDKLRKVHQSLKQLMIQQFGDIYAKCPSPEQLIDAATQQVVQSKQLPLSL